MESLNQTSGRHSRLWQWVMVPMLFVLVVALYSPSMKNDFIYDDEELILHQVMPRTMGDVVKVFCERHWYNLPYYRPVPRLTMVGQKFLHGDQPTYFHLFNAVLMGIACLLAYGLLRLPVFGIRPLAAYMGAALFAFHPIASSCVYPICSGRETLIPALFIIAAMYAFLRAGKTWYYSSLFMFSISLLSKEQAVIVPGLFVLADLLGLSASSPGKNARRWILRYTPVMILLIVYLMIRVMLFGGVGDHGIAVFQNPLGPLLSVLYALQTGFVPFMQLVYEPWLGVWISVWRLLVVLLAVVILGIGAYAYWPAVRKKLFFWGGWFLMAIFPTANVLVQEARFAERYVFLGLLGIIGLVCTIASKVWDKHKARGAIIGLWVALIVASAAISHHRNINFRDEMTFLNQWLKTNSEVCQVHFYLAGVYIKQKNLDAAESCLNRALDINPNWDEIHNRLSVVSLKRGAYKQSALHARQALRLNPDNVDAHIDLGLALAEQGQLEQAIEQYKSAIRLNPDSLEAHYNLAFALVRRGDVDRAISHYKEVLEINPDHEKGHFNLAVAFLMKQDIKGAIWHFDEALRINPDSLGAHINLGTTLMGQGRVEEGMGHFFEALRINPHSFKAHMNLGNAFYGMGRVDEAIEHYDEALGINPDAANAYMNLGICLAAQGKADEATHLYREALRKDPKSSETYLNLGNTLVGQGKLDEGIESYRSALRINPDFVQVHYNLGVALGEEGKISEAIHHYLQVLRKDPDFFAAHYNLAVLFLRKGEIKASIAQFREALRIRPGNGDVRNLLKRALTTQKAIEDSRRRASVGVNKGFNDWELLKNDRDLKDIRDSSYYRGLVGGQAGSELKP